MKKIKKYNSFIIENISSNNLSKKEIVDLRSKFCEDILDKIDYISFSRICPDKDADPDEDYNNIKELIGWPFEKIRNIFSKEADEICGFNFFDMVRNELLNNQSGYTDIFLYKLAEELKLEGGKIYLGGESWQDIESFSGSGSENEYLIKCAYGYHQTKYGKLFLNQIGLSEEELIKRAVKDLREFIDERVIRNINVRDMKLKDFSITESDRIIIYLKEISNYLLENGINIKPKEILSDILKEISVFNLDVNVTKDDELIIWAEFDEFR